VHSLLTEDDTDQLVTMAILAFAIWGQQGDNHAVGAGGTTDILNSQKVLY